MLKGPKFREPERVRWDNVLNSIQDGIEKCKITWASKERVDVRVLNEWATLLINKVKGKIKRIQHKKRQRHFSDSIVKKVLNREDVKKELSTLHRDFVLLPTDKAQNNISIVCKKIFIDSLLKEVNFECKELKDQKSSTYESVKLDRKEILSNHQDFSNRFNIRTEKNQLFLPFLFWTPKMHKQPVKHRFICASYACTTKPISSVLTKVLKLIYESHKIYCERINGYTNYNCMWIIQNSDQVLEAIKNIQSNIRNIKTYDFSTLYTSIPHKKLKERISILVTKTFESQNWKFITVKEKARWSIKMNKTGISLNEESVINLINWLIDNTYITIGDRVFRQVIGIPMGTDCAPYLANLFLYSYELDFMKQLLKDGNHTILRKFNKCFRYIDDLLTINNDNFIEKWKHKIYPPELNLTSEDKNDQKVNFLDLHLFIQNKKLFYGLYDKRDNFNFPIVNFPNLSGNIPTGQSYGVFMSQLNRYAKICQFYKDFKYRVALLVKKLLSQNFKLEKLQYTFTKFLSKHEILILKYGNQLQTELSLIISSTISQV